MSTEPADTAEEMLCLRDITVARGGRAVVRDVSIDIVAGEVTALLGPNGAGKSSLVLAVGGVLRPEAGSVLLAGRDYAGRRPERIRRAGIAIVPEQLKKLDHENVVFRPLDTDILTEGCVAWRNENPSAALRAYVEIVEQAGRSIR